MYIDDSAFGIYFIALVLSFFFTFGALLIGRALYGRGKYRNGPK